MPKNIFVSIYSTVKRTYHSQSMFQLTTLVGNRVAEMTSSARESLLSVLYNRSKVTIVADYDLDHFREEFGDKARDLIR